MKHIRILTIILSISVLLIEACQKTEHVEGYGVGALSIRVLGTKVDSIIPIVIKNNYPATNSISTVVVKSPSGVVWGNAVLPHGIDSTIFYIAADSLRRYALLSGTSLSLTSNNEMQTPTVQFLVKEKPATSRMATLLVAPSIVWTPYVYTKSVLTGADSVKYITDITMQTLQPVYLAYKITSGMGIVPKISINLKNQSTTTQTIPYTYRTFGLADTIKVTGANYKVNDKLTFYIKDNYGKYVDSVACLTSAKAVQQIGVWPFTAEVTAQKFTLVTSPYFNLFSRNFVTTPSAAGVLKFNAAGSLQALSSSAGDTLVSLFKYTDESSYKAYSGNDVYKAYTKYTGGVPVSSYTGIASGNAFVVRMIIKKNGAVVDDTWGLINITGVTNTVNNESITFSYRNSPKKY